LLIGLSSLSAQRQSPWTVARTAWGDPDLTGTWPTTESLGIPFERDPALGLRNRLTEAEFAVRQRLADQQRALDQADFDLQDIRPPAGPELTLRGAGQPVATAPVGPAPHWLEPGTPSRQASLIVDPLDGRFPPLTPEGRQRSAAITARRANPRSLADRTLYPRCITRGVVGSVLPMVTDSGNEILQAPGYVAIRHEMIHETRIIPLGGRPFPSPAIRQYMGVSRGQWDGDSLVVETRNLAGDLGVNMNGGGVPTLSPRTVLTERFTRRSVDVLSYRLTVNDPGTWVSPWTVEFPWRRDASHTIFEFSCHEGNLAMRNILSAELTEAAGR
jgi:hypothetical protein